MFCPNCGNQLPDGSRFCGKCGTQLDVSPGVQPTGVPGPYAPVAEKPKSKAGLVIGIVAAVVVVAGIVAAIVFGVTSCVGGASTGSAQGVVNGVNSAFVTMTDGDFSSSALSSGMDQLIDLMPSEVIETALREDGMTREEVSDEMEDMFGELDEYSSYMGLIDIKLNATLGTQLSSDELSDVNDDLIDGGASAPAAEGYHIGLDIEVSALGETESQSVDESGLIAVRVGNGWYLWGEGLAL